MIEPEPAQATPAETIRPETEVLREGHRLDGRAEVRDDVEARDIRRLPRGARKRINSRLCHSDVSVIDGTIPFPTPVVLGHEGAGVVEAVGSAVTKVKVGDHVVLTTLGNCRTAAIAATGASRT